MWLFNAFALWRSGGRAVRLEPGTDIDMASLDGLVLGGGDDIDAGLYGGDVRLAVRIDLARDTLERSLLRQAMDRDMPVLGICRGAQMINIARGGSLHGDVYSFYPDLPRIYTPLPRKTIELLPGSRLRALIGRDRNRVNALHHQAVDRLGANLRIAARDEHGVVQAIECEHGTFLMGVQWHPEFLVFDQGQLRLYRALVAAAASPRHKRDEGPTGRDIEAIDPDASPSQLPEAVAPRQGAGLA
jgi:putative glutamine amidotransferase